MDIQSIRRFVAAAESGSFGRAAELLSVTQPAITRSIRLLEDELGVPLFERHGRGVQLTNYGTAFVEHARCLLNDAERALRHLRTSAQLARGRIALGIPRMLDGSRVHEAVITVMQRFPGVDVRIEQGPAGELIQRLQRGELDVAVSTYEGDPELQGIERMPFLPFRTAVFARADHPLALRSEVSLAELSEAGWAIIDTPGGQASFARWFERTGPSVPVPRVLSQSVELLKRVVAGTDLLTVMEFDLVAPELARQLLKLVPTEPSYHPVPAYVMIRRNSVRSPEVTELMKALRGLQYSVATPA